MAKRLKILVNGIEIGSFDPETDELVVTAFADEWTQDELDYGVGRLLRDPEGPERPERPERSEEESGVHTIVD